MLGSVASRRFRHRGRRPRRGFGWAAVGLSLLWAVSASAAPDSAAAPDGAVVAAQPSPVSVGALIGGADSFDGALLVGRSGEIYRARTPRSFEREGSGGVGPSVIGAYLGKELFVIGGRDPLFVRGADAYHAARLTARGSVTAAGNDSAAVIAIGRQLFALDRAGNKWNRLAGLPTSPAAVWAASDGTVFAALHRAKQGPALIAVTAKSQQEFAGRGLSAALGADEQIRSVHGVAGATRQRRAYLLTSLGRALYVEGERVREVAAGAAVTASGEGEPASSRPEALQITAAHYAHGALWALAVTTGAPARSALLEVRDGKLRQLGDGPPLPDGDRGQRLLVDKTGNVLAATSRGRVWARIAGVWQTVTVTAAPAAAAPGDAKAGPASSR